MKVAKPSRSSELGSECDGVPFFSFSISTPKSTSKTSPLETEISLTPGVVHHFGVIIPTGHAGLAHLQVRDGLHQIFPANGGDDYHGDGLRVELKEFYELEKSPFGFTAVTWNLDDTFAHEFIIEVGVLPKWVLLPQLAAKKATGILDRLMGRKLDV